MYGQRTASGNQQYKSVAKRRKAVRTKYLGGRRRAAYTSNVRALVAFAGVEKKYFDCARGAFAIPAPADASGGEADPATLDCLNCPAQGDTEVNRDGRQITMESINIKGVVQVAAQANQTAADVIPDVFIALVLDKQTNAAQLNSEDVFENPSASASLASSPFLNLSYTRRFKVLKTVKVTAQQIAGAIQPAFDGTNLEQQGAQIPWSMFCDLKNLKTNFLSGETTSVVAAIADNSLHIIAYASGAGLMPNLYYNSRLRFRG